MGKWPGIKKSATYVNEKEVRVPAILRGACLDLLPKRANAADRVCRVRAIHVWSRKAEESRLVKEVIDEIHLLGGIAVRPVHIAVKRCVRDVECCFPHVRKLCTGVRWSRKIKQTVAAPSMR